MAIRLYSDRFNLVGNQRPTAWKTLGHKSVHTLPVGTSVMEAFDRADMLYSFAKMPLEATMPDGMSSLPISQVALMREPTATDPIYRPIAVVDHNFGVIQQADLARALQPISDKWPIDSVGDLDYGTTTFLTFRTGGYTIANDDIDRYLLVMDGKGGNAALRFALIDVRLACTNQLQAAWNRAMGLRVAFSHHANVQHDLETYVSVFNSIAKAQETQKRAFEILASTRVARDDAKSIISAAFPLPTPTSKQKLMDAALKQQGFLAVTTQELLNAENEAYEHKLERAHLMQVATLARHDALGEENPLIVGTAWSAYNAVVEVSDNRVGSNARTAAAAVLFGVRGQERAKAFHTAWELAGSPALN